METNKLRETMDVIITNTFNRLETVYNNHKEGFNSKLPLPTALALILRHRLVHVSIPNYHYQQVTKVALFSLLIIKRVK